MLLELSYCPLHFRTRMFSVGSLVCLRPMDGFATVDLNPSLNVSTCSHTMHFSCFIV